MPLLKGRALAHDEGGFAFFSGLYLLLLQVGGGKKKGKSPKFGQPISVWKKPPRVQTNSAECGLNLSALMSVPVPSTLQSVAAPAGEH